jgi:hypothetical protein
MVFMFLDITIPPVLLFNFAFISPTSIGGGFKTVNQWELNLSLFSEVK